MEPSRDRPIPLYYQLKTLLLEEIVGGSYGTDGRLPTETSYTDSIPLRVVAGDRSPG